MAKDPVCGMEVDEKEAEFCTRFEHETFYFCSKACQDHFEQEEGIQHSEPVKRREWRSLGVTTAFIIALFTEMYGFPLTIYILTALLGAKYPSLNPFSHESGHLWVTLFGGGPAMLLLIHLVSNGLMIAGFLIMGAGWKQE